MGHKNEESFDVEVGHCLLSLTYNSSCSCKFIVPDNTENALHRCVFVEFWSTESNRLTAGIRKMMLNRVALRMAPRR